MAAARQPRAPWRRLARALLGLASAALAAGPLAAALVPGLGARLLAPAAPALRAPPRVALAAEREEDQPGGTPVLDGDVAPSADEPKRERPRPGHETLRMQQGRVAKKAKFLKSLRGKYVPWGPKPWDQHQFLKVSIQTRLKAKQASNTKIINQVVEELRRISGMHPRVVKAKHDVNAFGWRKGAKCGVAVNLNRYEHCYSALPVHAMFSSSSPTDELTQCSTAIFDDKTMKAHLTGAVYARFKEALVTGAPTSEDDMKVIAEAMFKWARQLGAVSFAHWFFPMRGGGGGVGGSVGAYKMDTLIDLDWSSAEASKPFHATLPYERLFFGETDGSSFPNGGLRATHTAAAFTTWDRSSPCFVMDKVLRIPASFISHLGACIDDKTPLLRSNDALNKEGLRLLKAINIGADAKQIHSFLGWEQEFFVIKAEHYLARPDLVNCGRTLFGALPPRHQQADLNYFAPVPPSVSKLLFNIQAVILQLGVPMAVVHNEVAPAQHEMSPIYCQATFSSDNNVLFMEVATKEAEKLGLVVLFHEKPFAGINGSGKHNNWSVGTDTGLNFFYPGKTDPARELFVTGIACLSYGLKQHNDLVRCSVATAGNDHRLGAQEAPPAIISLYPGTGFEAHVDAIIAGGPLLGYKAEKKLADPKASAAQGAPCGVEDRNRTAPFPFCGNRFEFRAVGSSQNCSFPIAIVNTIMASGMDKLSSLIEGGKSHRDAVAEMFKENRSVIFTGNGYSAEWPEEAKKRGLSNLNTTPLATATFNSQKAKDVFSKMGIFSPEECDARQEVMYENYNTMLSVEVQTMVQMVESGIIPACAKDLAKYASAPSLKGDREEVYVGIKTATDKLKELISKKPHDLAAEATYLCETVKPQMAAVRALVDKAEGLLETALYPYPTYEELLYSHHS